MPETKLKHEAGLGGAALERGKSFINAAQLIVAHLSDEQKQRMNAIEKDQFPLRALSNTQNSEKSNLELLEEYIAAIHQHWASLDPTALQMTDLAQLERTLIEAISDNLYFDPKKPFKAVKDELDNAENHANWKARQPKATTTNADVTLLREDNPISHFTPTQTHEWLNILGTDKPKELRLLYGDAKPKWFTALPEWEQNYFTQRVQAWQDQSTKPDGIKNLGDYLGPVPTTIRRYPGAPNAYVSTATLSGTNDKGEPQTESFLKIRSGVIAPAKMKAKGAKGKAEKVEITKQNLEQLVVVAIQEKIKEIQRKGGDPTQAIELPILLQTLYSPPMQPPGAYNNTAVMKAFDQVRAELQNPDKFLAKHGVETQGFKVGKIDLLYSNRPVNNARGLSWISNLFSKQGSESRKTDSVLADYVNKMDHSSPDYKIAKAALDSYQSMPYLRNTIGMIPPTQSNSIAEMAALEQIIAGKVGVRVGSCVSGKDREEMITEVALAQQEFFLKHGKFPPPYTAKSAEDKALRNEFLENVARAYLTGHGQELAGENSKGCDGLKNIVDVLGKDVCAKIRERAPEYGIDPEKFDPVKSVQKIAGLNKLDEKKLKVSILDFVKSVFQANPLGQTKQKAAASTEPVSQSFESKTEPKPKADKPPIVVGYHRSKSAAVEPEAANAEKVDKADPSAKRRNTL